MERGDIVLKYYHALSNGLFVWAGMSYMVELNALWDEIAEVMRKEGRTLGVFLPKKELLAYGECITEGIYLRTGPPSGTQTLPGILSGCGIWAYANVGMMTGS